MPAKKKAVVKSIAKTGVAIVDTSMFAEDAGMGVTSLGTEDLATPFLKLVQNAKQASAVGAEIGDIFNSVTKEIYTAEEGVSVINCGYSLVHLEWATKELSIKPPEHRHTALDQLPETVRGKDGREMLTNGSGNYLEKTAEHYVLLVDEDDFTQQALLTMKSTSLKVSKQWNSALRSQKMKDGNGKVFIPPRFSTIWKLTTTTESNVHGTWSQWQVAKERVVDSVELYSQAKSFAELISAGEVKVQHVQDNGNGNDSYDDDIPF